MLMNQHFVVFPCIGKCSTVLSPTLRLFSMDEGVFLLYLYVCSCAYASFDGEF